MPGHHGNTELFEKINEVIKSKKPLTFQSFHSSPPGFDIEHSPPDSDKVKKNSELYIYDSEKSYSHIIINMRGVESEMVYVGGYDMYIGYRGDDNQNQIILRFIEFGDKKILQITYHNINNPSGHAVTDNGTIHPRG